MVEDEIHTLSLECEARELGEGGCPSRVKISGEAWGEAAPRYVDREVLEEESTRVVFRLSPGVGLRTTEM